VKIFSLRSRKRGQAGEEGMVACPSVAMEACLMGHGALPAFGGSCETRGERERRWNSERIYRHEVSTGKC
jgi:hypothetical protein